MEAHASGVFTPPNSEWTQALKSTVEHSLFQTSLLLLPINLHWKHMFTSYQLYNFPALYSSIVIHNDIHEHSVLLILG